ncbi:hypothetical protein BJ138DRAFT_1018925, partial [Hygrophoropsis aurantiaca]
LFELTLQQTYFGSHCDKLKWIKNSYDPSGLLIVSAGVGSEDWTDDLNCQVQIR